METPPAPPQFFLGLVQWSFLHHYFFFSPSLYWICYNVASVLCFALFLPCPAVWDLSSPTRLKLEPPALEGKVLTTGLPGKSLQSPISFISSSPSVIKSLFTLVFLFAHRILHSMRALEFSCLVDCHLSRQHGRCQPIWVKWMNGLDIHLITSHTNFVIWVWINLSWKQLNNPSMNRNNTNLMSTIYIFFKTNLYLVLISALISSLITGRAKRSVL